MGRQGAPGAAGSSGSGVNDVDSADGGSPSGFDEPVGSATVARDLDGFASSPAAVAPLGRLAGCGGVVVVTDLVGDEQDDGDNREERHDPERDPERPATGRSAAGREERRVIGLMHDLARRGRREATHCRGTLRDNG